MIGGECNCIGGDFGEYVKDSLGLLPLLSLHSGSSSGSGSSSRRKSSSTCVF